MKRRWAWHVLIAADNDLVNTVKGQKPQFADTDPRNLRLAAQVDIPEKDTQRFALNDDGSFKPLRAGKRARNLNAGSRQSLIDFLIASRHLRPARSIAVIFSGHGTGVTDLTRFGSARPQADNNQPVRKGAFALGIDDTSRDYLDNHELQYGLEFAYHRQAQPEIIGCDACLMATVEAAHQLRDRATFLVASQHTTPASGWPYRKILQKFSDRTTPLVAVKTIVDTYATMEVNENIDDATLSAVRLELMTDLARELDRLGEALLPFIKPNLRLLAEARQEARTFANFDSIDLYGYVAALKKQFNRAIAKSEKRRAVTTAAARVLKVLGRAVVATNNNPRVSRAHGLSVYLPNAPVIDAYHDLPLSKAAPNWYDFVATYGANRHLV